MDRSLLIRAGIIVVVLALAAVYAYPPGDINYGLDLQGGMHLVLRVETDDALRAETDKDIDQLLRELEDAEIAGVEIDRTGDMTFTALGVPSEHDAMIRGDIVSAYLPGWGYERLGNNLFFVMDQANVNEIRELAVRQALETIRNRIDAFGVTEPIVHREGIGGDRIVIQLPGVDDPERVKRLIKNTAFLEFRLVKENTSPAPSRQAVIDTYFNGVLPNDTEILLQKQYDENKNVIGEQFLAIEKRLVITGRDLRNARPTAGQFNEPTVQFTLTHEGGRKFGEVSGANVGRQLAIILDGIVISAPVLESRITTDGIIRGAFTTQEVQDLATVLRSGALPAGLTYLEERTVGPSLGQDSIDKGLSSGLIGGALVVLLMLAFYRLTGINAVTALGLNIVLVFGALAMFDATLTVPGIAGIVLTIGMAVDANVLVFERIKEELRAGRTVKSAIGAGFSKALSSILDANVTTMIAAMFLFIFGTGPIRGFAVTLSVGILASLFTAVFVSRWLFDFVNLRRQRVEKISI
ncbi:MAG: protein translocase subunit SecD [bacterium]|nr:protein translocase subunit SecD [bacterium]